MFFFVHGGVGGGMSNFFRVKRKQDMRSNAFVGMDHSSLEITNFSFSSFFFSRKS